jgi:hypothetical protein
MNRAISKIMTAVLALAVLCIGVGASVAAEKQEQVGRALGRRAA